MSWQATSWVKSLTQHADGSRLTARQKLVLFVLADYHNEERGFAWVSTRRAASEALTSQTWFVAIVATLEKHGTISIERREGQTSLYHFPLIKPLNQSKKLTVRTVQVQTVQTEQSRLNQSSHEESGVSIRPDFRPVDYLNLAIEESRKTRREADDILKEWREHPEKRPVL